MQIELHSRITLVDLTVRDLREEGESTMSITITPEEEAGLIHALGVDIRKGENFRTDYGIQLYTHVEEDTAERLKVTYTIASDSFWEQDDADPILEEQADGLVWHPLGYREVLVEILEATLKRIEACPKGIKRSYTPDFRLEFLKHEDGSLRHDVVRMHYELELSDATA